MGRDTVRCPDARRSKHFESQQGHEQEMLRARAKADTREQCPKRDKRASDKRARPESRETYLDRSRAKRLAARLPRNGYRAVLLAVRAIQLGFGLFECLLLELVKATAVSCRKGGHWYRLALMTDTHTKLKKLS